MAPSATTCSLSKGVLPSRSQLRNLSVCRVANVATAVTTEDRKTAEKSSKQVHHSAATPAVAAPDPELLDEVCAPLDLPAGEAVMAVKDPDVTTSVAAVTRSIVFVASEAAPFAKTGGLGDVCGSLPKALAKRGHRVMVVMPRYDDYEGANFTGVNVDLDGCMVGFHHKELAGVDFVFVDHPSYKRPGGMYGDENGAYGDNQWRFKLLCQAALEAPLALELDEIDNSRPSLMVDLPKPDNEARAAALALAKKKSEDAVAGKPVAASSGDRNKSVYGQDCIFVANDWFAGLVPIYLASRYRPGGIYLGARCIMLLHNLCHQGVYPPGTFDLLGLPGAWYQALEWQYPPEQRQGAYEEEGRAINTLKGAITTADRIVAVSPGYAYEIQTGMGGFGMEWLLGSRQYALNGVLNGIDYTEWNPATDAHLPAKYSAQDLPALMGKARCKREMQRELGLPERDDVPLLAFIGRLDSQKGADLILAASRWIVEQGAQIVCLGTGDPALEDGLRWMESEFPQSARGWVGFNVPFSHRLTAAADILLMPSRFEPCGLNQLYAMHYGTVPVAHATGGLRDTVKTFDPYNPEGTTGWAFEEFSEDSFKHAIWNALETYRHDKDAWKGLQKRGMEMDFTWNHAAEQYEQIFEWAKHDLPYCG